MSEIEKKIIEAAAFRTSSLKTPNPWVGHIPFANWIIQSLRPKCFVELGTHSGNSYFAFCKSVQDARLNTKCYAIDTWEGDDHATKYSVNVYQKVCDHNEKNYKSFSQLIRSTFDEAVNQFDENSIDLLHIDGLHTYQAVKHDFETWLPKLSQEAIVLFHDTQVRDKDFGVWRLWEELKKEYKNNYEFVHSHGLGVLSIKNSHETIIRDLQYIDEKYGEIFSSLSEIHYSLLKSEIIKAFDADWYLENNPDLKSNKVNPWQHFFTYGIFENRAPNKYF